MNHSHGAHPPAGVRRVIAVVAWATAVVTLAACGSAGAATGAAGTAADSSGTAAATADKTVTLVTHDSFAVDPSVLKAFEKRSGLKVQVLAQGDAGEMLSKVIVTKGNPLGDAVFGIDNTFATKALEAGVIADYSPSAAADGAGRFAVDGGGKLTAIDYGDVCVNVDRTYFEKHHLAAPTTYEDLAKPEYKNMLVSEDAATSSPGLAFLLGTIAHFGDDGWQAYWKSLVANGLKIDSGWTDAYTVDFSGSSGHGDRPLVVSYASSPPAEVKAGETTSPTYALLDTCFRQVEYAGVLAGAANPSGAEKLVDFLLSPAFQKGIPDQMYMYPVDKGVSLPADWATFAPVAEHPETLSPQDIDKNRQRWIDGFSDIVRG